MNRRYNIMMQICQDSIEEICIVKQLSRVADEEWIRGRKGTGQHTQIGKM